MNTGQSLLTILSMLLLSIIILRVNKTILFSDTVVSSSKLSLTAISLATSELEEIKSNAFDEYTVKNIANNLSQLSLASNFGPQKDSNNELYSTQFDDVDDYNGFDTTVSVLVDPYNSKLKPERYRIQCSVVYVSSTNPNAVSSSPTWNKKITVTVSDSLMTDTIKESSIFSYWFFR